jgi:hypothetical protein
VREKEKGMQLEEEVGDKGNESMQLERESGETDKGRS